MNYARKNRQMINKINSRWVSNNKEKVNKNVRDRAKRDFGFRILKRLRANLGNAVNVYTKTSKIYTSKKYGVDYEAIIEHLKPFPEDLSKYHIDHIRPLVSFNFVNEDGSTNIVEVNKAFAPENHQWLLAKDNMTKGSNYNGKRYKKN